MLKGTVTQPALDLKDSPGALGHVVARLTQGTELQVLERWYSQFRVKVGSQSGFVSNAGVNVAFDAEVLPPEANESEIRQVGKDFLDPKVGWVRVRVSILIEACKILAQ